MKSVQLESEVGADGVLKLRVPLGVGDSRTRVVVTIEPLRPTSISTASNWHDFVKQTYGSCAGLGLEEPQDSPIENYDRPT